MTVRVGVVGCGVQGRVHLDAYRDDARVEISAVYDLDRSRAEACAAQYGARPVAALEQMWPLVDAVSICTMPASHRDLAVAALGAGVHVLVEKPVAMDAGEVSDILSAAGDRVVHAGFNMRRLPESRALKAAVDEGRLGRPVYTRAWTKAVEVPWWGRHYQRSASGGGALASTAVHILDLAHWLVGTPEPVAVSASSAALFPRKRAHSAPETASPDLYDVEDLAGAHIRFADGSWMTLETGWMWDLPDWSYSLEVVGDAGTGRLVPYRLMVDDGTRAVPGESVLPDGPAFGDDRDAAWKASVAATVTDFVTAVQTGVATGPGADLLAFQRLVDAIYRSAAERREVRLEEVSA